MWWVIHECVHTFHGGTDLVVQSDGGTDLVVQSGFENCAAVGLEGRNLLELPVRGCCGLSYFVLSVTPSILFLIFGAAISDFIYFSVLWNFQFCYIITKYFIR